MDRKTILILAVCVVVWVLLNKTIGHYFPPVPAPAGSTNALPAAVQSPAATATAAGTSTNATPATPALMIVDTNAAPEELLVVTNSDARYTFTSYGGGLKRVELLKYHETVGRKQNGGVAVLNAEAHTPVLAILDGEAVQGDGIFQLATNGAGGVRAGKQLANGLSIVKDFTPGEDYLVNVTVRFENRSEQSLTLPSQEWVVGTATPVNAQDKGLAVGWMWFNGSKTIDTVGASHFSSRGFGCTPRTPPTEYRGGQSNVVWAAAHNQFFALVVIPHDPAADIVARKVELPPYTGEEAEMLATNAPPPQGYETTLFFPGVTLTNAQSLQRELVLFAGPKEYRTLARVAFKLNNNLDQVMGFDSIFPFYRFGGFFAKALLLAMNGLHSAVRLPYGWTIIAITVILKLVFWPLTAASTRSMKKMQSLQPQIKAIQEKYKDDPMKVQKKTMELWKENKVNPMGGCLPGLIQMPVFIGFITMVRSAIELRGASFLWIADLSQPDTIFVIKGLGFIPFIGIAGVGLPINPLPLIMVGTMLWQSHVAPMSPGVDPTQQKMMRYMPLMFLVFFYQYSSGMALYWTVNTVLSVVQTKLTKTRPAQSSPAAPALTPPPKKRK